MMELNFFRSNVFISDFPTFVNYWQNQRAKIGFPKRCIFYKYTNMENLLHFVRSFNLVSIYNDFRLFLDGWGVLEDDGLFLNFSRRRWKIDRTIVLVFLCKRRRCAFSLTTYASGLGSTNFSRILRFNFVYKTDFWVNSFVAQKNSKMSPLFSSSPVFVSHPLAAQTF